MIAFLFAKLGVIHAESAARASLLSGAIYLTGGIIGTLHHLYFAGTPTVALALGSVFSALEIVPLLLVGYEAVANILQTYQSVSVGYWSARSPEFLQTNLMQNLRWMRMIGDTVFAVGAISFVYFALDLMVRQRGARAAVRTDVAVETI